MSKNIIFVDHTAKLGGAQLSLLDIIKHFKKEADVLLFGEGEFRALVEREGANVDTYDLDKILYPLKRNVKIGQIIRVSWDLLKSLKTIRSKLRAYDIVYTNSFKSFIISFLSVYSINNKVILHIRDALTEENFSLVVIKIVIFLSKFKKVSVIANSNYSKECFVSAGGNEESCTVILNAIDPIPFYPVAPTTFSDEVKILSLGRISPWKGQHIVIEAIRNIPNVVLRIVGSPNFGEDDYYQYIKKLVSDYGMTSRVEFVPFSLDVIGQLSWSNIFIHSATSPEPFGHVVVEAMMAERIVIASAMGGVLEIITDSNYGVLVDAKNAEEVREAIIKIIDNPEHYLRVAAQGRDYAVDNFSLPVLYANLEQFIHSLRIER